MKYFTAFLSCLILFSCSRHAVVKHKKTDLEVLHYNGKVKMITYNVYKAIGDSTKPEKGNLMSKMITRCNESGYFTEQSYFKGGEKLSYQVVRRYDTNFNIIGEERVQSVLQYLTPGDTKPDSLSINRDSFLIKLDDRGNKAEVKAYENGKPWYRDVNWFDEKGNLIEQKEYVPWDTLNKIETFKYDEKGNLVQKGWLHPDSSVINKYSYTYNDKGDFTNLITYKSDGTVSSKETRKYDDKGNKTQDSCVNNDGSVLYNSRYVFTAFDDKGNWIKEIYYDNNKPFSVTERFIEYYK